MEAVSSPVTKARGGIKPRLRGWKSLLTHHTFRRISQWSFFLFIIFLSIRHIVAGENGAAITASPEAYCPFGGLETLYRFVTGEGRFVAHTHLSNVVMLVAVAVIAFLFRSAFCGWVCPLGLMQDLVSSASRFLQKRSVPLRRTMAALKVRSARLSILDRYLRYFKYIVLVWAVGGSSYFGYMVFRDYDPWAAFLTLAEFSFTPGIIVLGVTLIASFFVERPWCRYACPLGAASSLLGKYSPVYLERVESSCKVCQVCSKACPMGLPVHTANILRSADCMTCLECVGACPRQGALEVKIGLPAINR